MGSDKNRPTYSLIVIVIAIIAIVAYRYEQYIVERNYELTVHAPCDPASGSCFVSSCDPANDPGCDTAPYDKVKILAHEAPACLQEHTCPSFSCEGLSSCAITYCTDVVLEDGESCAEPPAPVQPTETATSTTP